MKGRRFLAGSMVSASIVGAIAACSTFSSSGSSSGSPIDDGGTTEDRGDSSSPRNTDSAAPAPDANADADICPPGALITPASFRCEAFASCSSVVYCQDFDNTGNESVFSLGDGGVTITSTSPGGASAPSYVAIDCNTGFSEINESVGGQWTLSFDLYVAQSDFSSNNTATIAQVLVGSDPFTLETIGPNPTQAQLYLYEIAASFPLSLDVWTHVTFQRDSLGNVSLVIGTSAPEALGNHLGSMLDTTLKFATAACFMGQAARFDNFLITTP